MKLGAVRPRRRAGGREQPRQRRDGLALPDDPGPASKAERCTNVGTSGGTPSRGSTGSNLVDMGRAAAHACNAGDSQTGSREARPEVTVKVCGVAVTRLQGKSWTPILPNGAW
jgi:hypothetical protein